jgi:triosephosphate isomerase
MGLPRPHFLVNCKAYPGTGGDDALALARTVECVAADTGARFALAPQTPDLRLVAAETELPLVAQAADPGGPGRGMGSALPGTLAAAGADAVLVNHPEREQSLGAVRDLVGRCHDHALETVVCVTGLAEAGAVATLEPDWLLFEVPEDIATGRAVVDEHPERVREFLALVDGVSPETHTFVGGGIDGGDDVARAFELGVDATGAASAVAGADDREAVLRDLASGFPGDIDG